MMDIRYFFIRDEKRFPIATVATARKLKGVIFGVATYNPKDRFDKQLSKDIALGRLYTVSTYIEAAPGTIRGKILEYIADNRVVYNKGGSGAVTLVFHLPKKVVKAAGNMLNTLNSNYAGFLTEPPEYDEFEFDNENLNFSDPHEGKEELE